MAFLLPQGRSACISSYKGFFSSRLFPVLASAVCLLQASSGQCQDPLEALNESWRWRIFDLKQEVSSSNSVSALHQDRYEFLYAATDHGLCRYDLWEWSKLENSDPFTDGEVLRFVESRNALYAVTQNSLWKVQGGVMLKLFHRGSDLHAASNQLGEVYVIDSLQAGHFQVRGEAVERIDAQVRLPPGRILDYQIAPDRVHWLVSSDGLYSRDMGRHAWRAAQDRDLDPSLQGHKCLRFFLVKSPPEAGLEPREARKGEARLELWALFQGKSQGPSEPASSLLARLEEGVWIMAATVEGAFFRQILQDSNGNYYATAEDGRLHFSPDGRHWKQAQNLGLGKVALTSGLLDSSGVLWFGTDTRGAAAFDPQSKRWEAISSGTEQYLPKVLSILETEEGAIWMGMTKGVAVSRPGEKATTFESVQGVPLEKITGLGQDSRGRVWVSSAESFKGAFCQDQSTWTKESRPGFSDHPVRRIVRDRAGELGELWFLSQESTPDGGSLIYHCSVATSYSLSPVNIPFGPVNDLLRAQGEEDTFWIATEEGLLRGTVEEGAFHLEKRYTVQDGLRSSRAWAIAEGPDGAIWLCYPGSSGGVARLKGASVTSFDEKDGLLSSEVWSIARAGQSLWFGSERGLTRFDGECWANYPVASSELGMTRVWPIFPSPRDPETILIGTFGQGAFRLRLDDRRRPRFTRHDFPSRAPSDGNVTFTWDARDFRSQSRPGDLLFRSRLDNGPWTPFTNAHSRDFRGLPLGSHSFEVEVRDLDGNRNREELVHRFEVGESLASRSLWTAGGAFVAASLMALGAYIYLRRTRSRRRSSRYRGLFQDFPGPVFILDGEGRVLDYNGSSPEVVGMKGARREDLLGRPLDWLPLFSSDEARSGLKAVFEGKDFHWQGSFLVAGGGQRSLELKGFRLRGKWGVNGEPLGEAAGAVMMVEDLTRQAEEESLRQRDRRLASLRQFADRVVESLGEALREPIPDELLRASPALLERRQRTDALLRRLSLFSRGKKGKAPAPASVSSILERMLSGSGDSVLPGEKFQPALNVRVDYRCQEGLWKVSIDEALLREALLEVLRNSSDAMPEQGTLTVRARNVRLEDDPGALPSGPYVEILVKDTGRGMDPGQLEHIFDPLYSTNPGDHALGIGLYITYGIVRSSGGDLRLESCPGQGTTVRVLLPAEG